MVNAESAFEAQRGKKILWFFKKAVLKEVQLCKHAKDACILSLLQTSGSFKIKR